MIFLLNNRFHCKFANEKFKLWGGKELPTVTMSILGIYHSAEAC